METSKNLQIELEKKIIALNEVIGQLEIEKKQVKDDMAENVEKILLPILKKLKLKEESQMLMEQLLKKSL